MEYMKPPEVADVVLVVPLLEVGSRAKSHEAA